MNLKGKRLSQNIEDYTRGTWLGEFQHNLGIAAARKRAEMVAERYHHSKTNLQNSDKNFDQDPTWSPGAEPKALMTYHTGQRFKSGGMVRRGYGKARGK